MDLKTVLYEKGILSVLDQRRLPLEEKRVVLNTVQDVYEAIGAMIVRGAPLIGITAAYGAALSLKEDKKTWEKDFYRDLEYLSQARPTAINLKWALQRMGRAFETAKGRGRKAAFEELIREACALRDEDARLCRRIGEHLQSYICDGGSYLTHCNAGALATAAYGTALSGFYVAREQGKTIFVWVDETRPWLQGLRLTSWELSKGNIPHKIIADSAAAFLVSRQKVDAVFVGADRIAANGDTANKIGTYGLSLACRAHHIPFIVAAPKSSFDPDCPDGDAIPIEKRPGGEILQINGTPLTLSDEEGYNPAFDITPFAHITAVITEEGPWLP